MNVPSDFYIPIKPCIKKSKSLKLRLVAGGSHHHILVQSTMFSPQCSLTVRSHSIPTMINMVSFTESVGWDKRTKYKAMLGRKKRGVPKITCGFKLSLWEETNTQARSGQMGKVLHLLSSFYKEVWSLYSELMVFEYILQHIWL